jgi:hypothetical protein
MDAETQSPIARWSSIIAANTAIYDDYFRKNGLPTPSHGVETPPTIDLPAEIIEVRNKIVEATTELQALVQGPALYLQMQTFQVCRLQTSV